MIAAKYELKNIGNTIIFLTYRTASDGLWFYQVPLNPGQTRNLWVVPNTLTYTGPSHNLKGLSPTQAIIPTPATSICPTPTQTPTQTQTPTPTPTQTPAPSGDINYLIIPNNDLHSEIIGPTPTPTG
jgi:hypothetical protein